MWDPHENVNDVVTVGIVAVAIVSFVFTVGIPKQMSTILDIRSSAKLKTPKIKSQPPNHDAAVQHIKQTHVRI